MHQYAFSDRGAHVGRKLLQRAGEGCAKACGQMIAGHWEEG